METAKPFTCLFTVSYVSGRRLPKPEPYARTKVLPAAKRGGHQSPHLTKKLAACPVGIRAARSVDARRGRLHHLWRQGRRRASEGAHRRARQANPGRLRRSSPP